MVDQSHRQPPKVVDGGTGLFLMPHLPDFWLQILFPGLTPLFPARSWCQGDCPPPSIFLLPHPPRTVFVRRPPDSHPSTRPQFKKPFNSCHSAGPTISPADKAQTGTPPAHTLPHRLKVKDYFSNISLPDDFLTRCSKHLGCSAAARRRRSVTLWERLWISPLYLSSPPVRQHCLTTRSLKQSCEHGRGWRPPRAPLHHASLSDTFAAVNEG